MFHGKDPSLIKGNQSPPTATEETLSKGETRVLSKPLATADSVMEKFGIDGHELLATLDIPTKEHQRVSHEGTTYQQDTLKLFIFRAARPTQAIRMNSPHFPITEWTTDWNREGVVTVMDEASLGQLVEMNRAPAEEFESRFDALKIRDEMISQNGRTNLIVGREYAFGDVIGKEGDLASRQHCSIAIGSDNQVEVRDLSINGTTITYQA